MKVNEFKSNRRRQSD